jgi:hypothetical protein
VPLRRALWTACGRCQSTSPKQRGLECADIADRRRGGLLDFRNGDRLDLDQKIRMREAANLDGGAGRQRPEIFHPDADMLEELVDVGGEGLGGETGFHFAGKR